MTRGVVIVLAAGLLLVLLPSEAWAWTPAKAFLVAKPGATAPHSTTKEPKRRLSSGLHRQNTSVPGLRTRIYLLRR